MRFFKFLSSTQIETYFKILEEKERKKHGADKDFFKLPEDRQRQIGMFNRLIDHLKKSALPEDRKSLILTGGIWYLRLWIKRETYSGWKGYVSDPNNSILYNGIPSVIGVSENNKFESISRNEALMAFRNFLHKNNFLGEIEPNMLAKVSTLIATTVNKKLKDINLQTIKEKLLNKHQKTKYHYWQDEIKYNRNVLIKNHVVPNEKQGRLVMKDFTNAKPFMSKEDKRRYDVYQYFQADTDIPRKLQNLSFLKPITNWPTKQSFSNIPEEIKLPSINDEFKTLVELNFFQAIKPSFVLQHPLNLNSDVVKEQIEERVRRYNVYNLFKTNNDELKKICTINRGPIKPSFFKNKPIIIKTEDELETSITHSRKNTAHRK